MGTYQQDNFMIGIWKFIWSLPDTVFRSALQIVWSNAKERQSTSESFLQRGTY